ncbi:hypothetical protein Vadar_028300 [Vaccinium darrowii]|uniref:Uncharacterized protein n=1 Tax=Vaccinium darrowii TaxID=229202 RepID=A0ACB7Y2E1_9ERIC|nr:hypothetical protein Vadar_028300 [Vaccinium darrowii]
MPVSSIHRHTLASSCSKRRAIEESFFSENAIVPKAKGKIKRAEKALVEVQESLDPAKLPSDLETTSDDERFLFREMKLKSDKLTVISLWVVIYQNGRQGI